MTNCECKKQVTTFRVDMRELERAKTVHEAERDLVATVLHILPKLTPNNLSAILLEAKRLEALADA